MALVHKISGDEDQSHLRLYGNERLDLDSWYTAAQRVSKLVSRMLEWVHSLSKLYRKYIGSSYETPQLLISALAVFHSIAPLIK